jgi:Helix-turn-helix domain
MDTMGQKFRAAREKKKMNVSRAAALTRIKVQHIEMMENDDFSKMPAPTYAKGFIRIYASFLGLDPIPLVQEYIDRHLNAPADNVRSARPKTNVETPGETAPVSERSNVDVLAAAKKIAGALVPYLHRIAGAAVAVFLLVGVVRCAVRLGSSSGDETSSPAHLDRAAIMKEPPVRYLDLPAEEEKP